MTFAKFPTLLAASSLAFVAACAGGPNNNENTQSGAVAGGLIGAVVGAATGDTAAERRQGALIGAALGAAGGAAIGNQLDRQEEELRQALGNNVGIVNNGQNLTVTLPQDILFATDSATLTGALQNDLVAVARSLNNNPGTTVSVIGHTDNVGEAGYNFDLSQRRAQAVTSVLINAGVSPSRLRTVGRGEDQPIASNLTADGRQQNRRVEIVITPN
ncbi:OmpA family protein [Yoonia sp. 208BN28-4]|uniref:OmpA family protein n=1 Tax=Yoonia sp. 208BN28-4 TaxID=3126505 RepID=UPI0030B528CB